MKTNEHPGVKRDRYPNGHAYLARSYVALSTLALSLSAFV